jgi:hypothetical protein
MSKETIEMGDLEKPAESETKHVEGAGESGAVELLKLFHLDKLL